MDSSDVNPPSNTWFIGTTWVSSTKQHLDRFSRFCRAHERDQWTQTTDRPTNHATASEAIVRISCTEFMQCGLKTKARFVASNDLVTLTFDSLTLNNCFLCMSFGYPSCIGFWSGGQTDRQTNARENLTPRLTSTWVIQDCELVQWIHREINDIFKSV